MRKLFILTIFISSLMISSMAHAEWTRVSANPNGDVLYVDFSGIKYRNGNIIFWELISRSQFDSAVTQVEGDCRGFRYNPLLMIFYSEPMAIGGPASVINKSQGWYTVPSNSAQASVLKAVCSYRHQ